MKQKLIIIALSGAIASPLAAYAETPSLGETVVTATRMSQPLDQTIAHTTVLNEQEIRKSGAPDVPALLRSLSGMEVVQSGGLGKVSSIYMRGTNSSHVLVLLDGVRINSATTGTTAIEHIMLDSIERIEVVRGNVSSLYGSEAIGGVIQLFTKRGHGVPAMNASAGLGSHGLQRLAAGFSGEVNDTSFSINAGGVRTSGVSAINPRLAAAANPDNDGYDNTTVNAQLRHAVNANNLLSATLFGTRGDSQYDSAFGLPADRNSLVTSLAKLSLASDNQLNDMWHSQVRLAQGTDNNHAYTNGAQQYYFKTLSNQFAWQNELKIAEAQRLNVALEHLGQAVSSGTLYTQTKRNVNSLLGGYITNYGAQQVQLDLRQDRYSDFGTVNTGLLGYGWQFSDAWRATASIGNAFKAPAFLDMYAPAAWGGNPNLRPERAQNREVALHYAVAGQRVAAAYFDNRIRDLIAYQFPLTVNINQARINGWELEYAGGFDDILVKANLTLQNPHDAATGTLLTRRAKEHASIAASRSFAAWEMGVELQHSGARQDVGIDTFLPVTLPGYQVFNLNARHQVNKDIAISVRIDNLFDRDYMLVHGYNTSGRTLFAGLSYQQ